ncbi:LysR substrate-binding domain-containing protein [Undibacterium cyanobacteriorum]|uniref:LysR substrate-binding domain-containing protein n=1 Tax=Undibacterium cyanobacteriorum TaxID=3073561 RepID=A0ABY9RJZ7_9BURK|nr:LysR substrate-binding domain-containing protein [Undibacterium sp. 20NA77.5]WMW81539.1 LysR substrate-binding domain-containing protein [Undibacterium sp. 20NA77.5]
MTRSRSSPSLRTAPFAALRAFEAAARFGSFKLAAEELSVTPAAISHQISALEDYLGITLFTRSNRLVELTRTGQELAREVNASFKRLQSALERASGQSSDNKVLIVSAAPSIAAKWLVPRLNRFHAHHPDIDLRLSSENQTHDLINDKQVDIVIRYGLGEYEHEEQLHIERLWQQTALFPVCSPHLASSKKHLKLNSLIDLQQHSLLRLPLPPDRQTGKIGERWNAWIKAIAESDHLSTRQRNALLKQADKGPYYSHEHLAIEMAKSGHGIALALDVLVIEDLLNGHLIRPISQSCRDPYAHFLIYRMSDQRKQKIRAFAEWVRAEAELSRQTLQQCRKV